MFEWKVEDMVLMNNNYTVGNKKFYSCMENVSREDKIAFVDSMQEGKLSYLLGLIAKFKEDENSLPQERGIVKTISLKAWINRNDTKYNRPIIDNSWRYGMFHFLGIERYIQYGHKGTYDTYDDLVDEAFYRLLKMCEAEEKKYFSEHDEYSILKSKIKECADKYSTAFGVHLGFCSNGDVYVYDESHKNKRNISMDEAEELIAKYEQLDALVESLTNETHIAY